MRYYSIFSGIEAASAAWEPLGWTPLLFSEIDEFPSAVLKYFDRMGLKDNAEKDAYKCADYLCRAVTGEWLEVDDAT